MIGVLALQGAFLEHIAKFQEIGVPAKEVRIPSDLESCDGLVIPGGESTAMGLIAERLGMLQPLKTWVAAKKPTWGTCAGMIMLAEHATGTKQGGQTLLGGMPITVHRNYFGAQVSSFEAPLVLEDPEVRSAVLNIPSSATSAVFSGVFIRAPAILSVGEGVVPIAWLQREQKDANVPELPFSNIASSSSNSSASSSSSSSNSSSSSSTTSSSSSSSTTATTKVIVAARNKDFLVTAFHPELTESPGFHRLFAQQVEKLSGKKLIGSSSSSSNHKSGVGGGISGDITSGNAGSHHISQIVVPGIGPLSKV